MKTALKIIGLILLLLIVFIILTPILFKGKLLEITKEEINKNVNAKVEFKDFDLSIFKSFPSLTVTLDELSVTGLDKFEKDTLAYIKQFYVDVDVMSVISGGTIKISNIYINSPVIRGIVLADSSANWDIAKAGDTTAVEKEISSEPSKFALALKHLEIKDADIIYDDKPGNMYTALKKFNFLLTGDFTESTTIIETDISSDQLTFIMDHVPYLNKTKFSFTATVDADLANSKYIFKDNVLKLNALELGFNGWISMPTENIDMDVQFGIKSAAFKEFFSLIPGVYMEGFENIKTEGKLGFSGWAKGTFNGEKEQYPAFNLILAINDAMFQYPDLPGKVSNIQVDLAVNNADGVLDNTIVDLKKLHVEFAENPFDVVLNLKTPISDPQIKCNLKGVIDLNKMKDFIPLDSTELSGIINADVAMEGRMSQIEKEEYESFKALGNIKIADLLYKDNDYPDGILIKKTEVEFSPQYVSLHSFDMQMGKTDISMNGKFENFIPYALSDDTIKGNLNLSSNMINADELMGEETAETETAPPATDTAITSAPSEPVAIPGNIDFAMKLDIKTIVYDGLDIKNTKGNILVKNSQADLSGLYLEMLGGSVNLDGNYNTQNLSKPLFDMDFGLNKVQITETFNYFNSIQKLAPFIKNCDGVFSMKLKMNGILDNEMSPVLNTINGTGLINTGNVKVEGSKLQTTLSETFKQDKYKSIDAKDLKILFDIVDGNITVKPFDINFAGNKSTIYGKSNLDQSIDYTMAMTVPKENLGAAAGVVDGLLSQASALGINAQLGSTIDFDIKIGGTMTDPKISVKPRGLGDSKGSLKDAAKAEIQKKVEEVKAQAKQEVEKVKEEAVQKVEETKTEVKKEATKEVEKKKEEVKKEATKETTKKLNNLIKK